MADGKRLGARDGIAVSSMLFGLFFGAGNLIFPIHMGQLAGRNAWWALLGFLVAGVGLPILGVAALGASRSKGLLDLSSRVGRRFGLVFTCVLYLTIGPLFAIPRCATVAYTVGIAQSLPKGAHGAWLPLFSLAFFAVVLALSLRPGKILTWVGKVLTPGFLVFLGILVAAALAAPSARVADVAPQGAYVASPFATGLLEGYNTMDALAGLAFGIVVVGVVRDLGVSDAADVARGTILSGVGSGLIMAVVYALVTVVGAQSRGAFAPSSNGGIAFAQIARMYLGDAGLVVLAVTVTVACLKTAVGLVTSCSQTFVGMLGGRVTYRCWAVVFTLVSFALANGGLDALIAWSLPVLSVMYPLAIMLIVLALAGGAFGYDRVVLAWAEGLTLPAALVGAAASAPKALAGTPVVRAMARVAAALPLASWGFGWVVPAAVGLAIGLAVHAARTRAQARGNVPSL